MDICDCFKLAKNAYILGLRIGHRVMQHIELNSKIYAERSVILL